MKINEKSQFVNQSKSFNSHLDSCCLWFTLLGDQNLDDNLKILLKNILVHDVVLMSFKILAKSFISFFWHGSSMPNASVHEMSYF